MSKFSKIISKKFPKIVTIVTLCHNIKSQKSNFYNWISITWQIIQLGVSQSEASILIGLLIGVQEVKILFLTFCCSIPGHMTHQYDSSTFYGSYWWALSIEWIKKGVHHLRGVLNWFWFVLGFSQSVIENSIGNPTIESTFENVLMMILIGWPIRFLKIIFLYLAYSRNVLQPDLVVCNNSLQQ